MCRIAPALPCKFAKVGFFPVEKHLSLSQLRVITPLAPSPFHSSDCRAQLPRGCQDVLLQEDQSLKVKMQCKTFIEGATRKMQLWSSKSVLNECLMP